MEVTLLGAKRFLFTRTQTQHEQVLLFCLELCVNWSLGFQGIGNGGLSIKTKALFA